VSCPREKKETRKQNKKEKDDEKTRRRRRKGKERERSGPIPSFESSSPRHRGTSFSEMFSTNSRASKSVLLYNIKFISNHKYIDEEGMGKEKEREEKVVGPSHCT